MRKKKKSCILVFFFFSYICDSLASCASFVNKEQFDPLSYSSFNFIYFSFNYIFKNHAKVL